MVKMPYAFLLKGNGYRRNEQIAAKNIIKNLTFKGVYNFCVGQF